MLSQGTVQGGSTPSRPYDVIVIGAGIIDSVATDCPAGDMTVLSLIKLQPSDWFHRCVRSDITLPLHSSRSRTFGVAKLRIACERVHRIANPTKYYTQMEQAGIG